MEMPRPVSRRQRDGGWLIRSQDALLIVEFPDEDFIQAQVHMQYVASGGIGRDHVRVSPIVSTDGKTARRSVGRLGWANLAVVLLNIRGFTQTTIAKNRQYRNR